MKKILVTGASGFIGQKIYRQLVKLKINVCGTVKNLNLNNSENLKVVNFSREIEWENVLRDVSCIIHCAGKVHEIKKKDNFKNYFEINIEGTKILAEQAIKYGVKKIIFLSSIKAGFKDPQDFYAQSKFEAEKVLRKISLKSNLELVVLRLPLVYGYPAKGNLSRLIKLINLGIPLPFGLIKNKRAFIGIENLIDVIINCIDNSRANGKTLYVSDGEDLSTKDLIRHLATVTGKSVDIFPFPLSILKFAGYCLGFKGDIDRLLGSLEVDIEYTKKVLDWKPPYSVAEGFKKILMQEE
jgi:nucleoside-diphosphate-sugar epimerase